ncbi:MAG: SDR family NAD(P)-dependent oxidoreductase, partial [Alphaproteobacteria bacterium]|nr:SDR family NAD(P)-dependent oxidoreductase [Alphaproteobacteria bacterium]
MAGRVEGKVCLITGGASGLGRADAIRLAEEGAKVVITDVNDEDGLKLAQEIGENAIFLKHDVSNEEEWKAVIKTTLDTFGKLNVVVNNAGIVIVATPEETTTEQWRMANSIMNDGVYFGIKYGIDAIKKSGEPGSIINMASTAAHLGYPVFFAYAACKGAVRSMTKSAAVHCQFMKYGIRVNSVHPGAIDTPMIKKAASEQSAPPPEPDPNAPPGPGVGEPVERVAAVGGLRVL